MEWVPYIKERIPGVIRGITQMLAANVGQPAAMVDPTPQFMEKRLAILPKYPAESKNTPHTTIPPPPPGLLSILISSSFVAASVPPPPQPPAHIPPWFPQPPPPPPGLELQPTPFTETVWDTGGGGGG